MDFAWQGSFSNTWSSQLEGQLLTSCEWRPGMLLNTLQCTGSPPQRVIQSRMSMMLRLRNLISSFKKVLGVHMFGSCLVKMKVNIIYCISNLIHHSWEHHHKQVCSVLPDIFYTLTGITEKLQGSHEITFRILPTTLILFNAQATYLEFLKIFTIFSELSLFFPQGAVIVFNLAILFHIFSPLSLVKFVFFLTF